MTNPIGNFQKFKFWFHAGISSNTFWAEITQNRNNCLQQWLAALALVPDLQAVLWTLICRSLVSPAQAPAVRHGWHGGRAHRTPPMPPSEPDHLSPSHRARTLLQHAAARLPRQNPALPLPRPTHTVYWPPLDIAGAPSPAYIKPPFFPEKNHTIPRTSLDNLSFAPVP
jgi:hypothetical protein